MDDLVDTPGKDGIHAELSTDDTTSKTLSQNEKKRDISGGVTFNVPVDLVLLLGDEKKKRDLATDLGVNTDLAVAIALALGYDVNVDGSISNQKKRNVIRSLLETVDSSVHNLDDTHVGVEHEWAADENENGGSGSDSEVDDETADESKQALDTQANAQHSNNALDALVVAGTGPATLVIRPSIEEEKRDVGNINVDNLSGNLNAAQDGVSAPADTKVLSKEKKRGLDQYARNGNFFDDAAGVLNHAFDDVGLDVIANLKKKEKRLSGDIMVGSGDGDNGLAALLTAGILAKVLERPNDDDKEELGLSIHVPVAKSGQSDARSDSDVSTKKEKRLLEGLLGGDGSDGLLGGLLGGGGSGGNLRGPSSRRGGVNVDVQEEIDVNPGRPQAKSDAQLDSNVSNKKEKRFIGGLLSSILGGSGSVSDSNSATASTKEKRDGHLDSNTSNEKEKRFIGGLLDSYGTVSLSDLATSSTEEPRGLRPDLGEEKRQNVNANVGLGGLDLDVGVDVLLGGLGKRLAGDLDANSKRFQKRHARDIDVSKLYGVLLEDVANAETDADADANGVKSFVSA